MRTVAVSYHSSVESSQDENSFEVLSKDSRKPSFIQIELEYSMKHPKTDQFYDIQNAPSFKFLLIVDKI